MHSKNVFKSVDYFYILRRSCLDGRTESLRPILFAVMLLFRFDRHVDISCDFAISLNSSKKGKNNKISRVSYNEIS